MPAVIDHTVQARLITRPGAARPLAAALRYDAEDALAVRILFPASASLDGAEVTWVFSRELLDAGLHTPSGRGDVQLWPHGPDRTRLALRAPEGTALVELETAEVRCFLRATYGRVPLSEENLSSGPLERGLDELLRGV